MKPSTADRSVKRERLLDILDRHDADRLWLASPTALSWYLDGSRVHTSLVGAPIAAVEVSRDAADRAAIYVNEVDRMLAEELPEGVDVVRVPWQNSLESVRSADALAEQAVEAELRAARATLLPAETARFRALGRETAEVLTRTLTASRADQSERSLAAALAEGVVAIGADPVVVMVAGSSRLGLRHPLPTDAPLGDRTMVVVCARRHGLVANITRWVRRTEPTAQDRDEDAAIRAVEAEYFAATRVGRTLAEVLADGSAAYARHGFAADEATRHHQGGAAGYAGRDPRATDATTDVVHNGQSFAWNPTAPGRKIEDTVLITDGAVESLTLDPEWPTTAVNGIQRPTELQL